MQLDFKKIVQEKSDEELIHITHLHRSDYRTETLKFADEEIKLRGLEPEVILSRIKMREANDSSERAVERKLTYVWSESKWIFLTIAPYALFIVSIPLSGILFLAPFAMLGLIPCGVISWIKVRNQKRRIQVNDESINTFFMDLHQVVNLITVLIGVYGIGAVFALV